MHGGFYVFADGRPGGTFLGTHIGGDPVWLTTHHYDTIVSETRITSYLGILTGQVPGKHYYAPWRTFPASCDWSWHEMQPVGETRTYLGIDVYEGAYTYRGMHVVPGWGGSMFEELMPAVFVPEEEWGPRSWGVNHPRHVRAEREHGLLDARYGYWGFSPSSNPAGGYREYGVDALGLNPEGYFSDQEKTNLDVGFGDCRPATNPDPTYGDGVVTPHASFLAMMFERGDATANLNDYYLTDDGGNPEKWRFPVQNLAAGASIVVFASERNLAVAGQELHTNFKLDAGGEYRGLIRAAEGTMLHDAAASRAAATYDLRRSTSDATSAGVSGEVPSPVRVMASVSFRSSAVASPCCR